METSSDEAGASDDPFVGRSIGNYCVEKRLGEGGMGSIYLLRHTSLPNTLAALKVLKWSEAAHGNAALRFEQEALVAAAIASHRIVRPLDVGQFDDGTPYILMEYVDGRSLEAELQERGAMPLRTALTIAARVADTMAIAHEKSIVHRDLKPSNIMLTSEGKRDFIVKLLDFGVARATGAIKRAYTQERVLIGTPGYMSPEAAIAMPLDARTDVFSLGIILYEMLTGKLPFASHNVRQALTSVIADEAPPVSTQRPAHLDALPAEVEAIVEHALAKGPRQRYTMVEMHGALTTALERLGMSPHNAMQSLCSAVPPTSPQSEAHAVHAANAVTAEQTGKVVAVEDAPTSYERRARHGAGRRLAWGAAIAAAMSVAALGAVSWTRAATRLPPAAYTAAMPAASESRANSTTDPTRDTATPGRSALPHSTLPPAIATAHLEVSAPHAAPATVDGKRHRRHVRGISREDAHQSLGDASRALPPPSGFKAP